MAQRSFFLFGAQPMYAVSQLPITIASGQADDMIALRAFIGNDDLGWKVAWSDRMVYIYGSFWLAGLLFSFVHARFPGYEFKPFTMLDVFLLTGMPLDGVTHFITTESLCKLSALPQTSSPTRMNTASRKSCLKTSKMLLFHERYNS